MMKRKRLAKACDHCHKSKRRCDGTSPCSNCYYASKPCSYTDNAGRPVPAPNQLQPQQNSTHQANDRPAPLLLDPATTRELTNLFFTHCHPSLAIFHKPSFTHDLAHNLIPQHLIHAVCAMAAKFSKQPSLKITPSRFSGRNFAEAARAIMFHTDNTLLLPPSLHTAQAACLLTIYEVVSRDHLPNSGTVHRGEQYRELTLHLLQALNVHTPDNPLLTPVPSQAYVHASLQRECIRRIFWIMYMMDCSRGIFYRWEGPTLLGKSGDGYPNSQPPPPIPQHQVPSLPQSTFGAPLGTTSIMGFTPSQLRLRLPADETSFELGVIHESLPEYLYLPAVRTQYPSELGHLLRVQGIYMRIEEWLDSLVLGVEPPMLSLIGASNKPYHSHATTVADLDVALEEWYTSLPSHLQFTPETLQFQGSMFPTSSNTGPWAYSCLHMYHASAILGLGVAKQKTQSQCDTAALRNAFNKINSIIVLLGGRARNSMILGVTLWPILKYTRRNDQKLKDYIYNYEEFCGVRVDRVARNRKWAEKFVLEGWRDLIPPEDASLPPLPNEDDEPPSPMAQPLDTPLGSSDIDPALLVSSPQSLPSLKASGLLDYSASGSEIARTMPVGLPWLANEARV